MENMDENFEELLEEYLNMEEMESKLKNDDKEILQEKAKSSSDSIFTVDDTISIGRFVNDYLNISGDCHDLYHSGLKDLKSDYVMGVDNNFANKNPELVKQGYLLLVIDSRNHRGTYVNPHYLEKILSKDEVEKEFKIVSHMTLNDIEKLVEYYNKYIELQERVIANQKFYNLLKQAHKIKQLNRIKEKKKGN